MEQISITRALAELKLLDARIGKKVSQSVFVGLHQNRKDAVLHNGESKKLFEEKAKASLQSVKQLIERRSSIKSAVLMSNSTTEVTISGEKYKVVEAIERKNSIEYEKNLLLNLRHQLTNCNNEIARQKPELERNVQDMLEKNLGGDKAPTKEDYEAIAKPFVDANELKIIDPCNVSEEIEKLDTKIDDFLAEVDFVLSESNAKTMIDI